MPPRIDRSAALTASCRLPRGFLDIMRGGPAHLFPTFVERGEGAYVWDVDGNRYVDWMLGKGPVSLGHARPEVDERVAARARRGFMLGLCPEECVLLADRLQALVPAAEKSFFVKSGSDAVSVAVRLARAFTGRTQVLSAGYHGWHDPFVVPELGTGGLPRRGQRDVHDFGYDLERLGELGEAHRGDVAAVIVSPEPGFFDRPLLAGAARLARDAGALFIVDEVLCGFRVSAGGVHQREGLAPDLVTFSKALANGYPLAVVSGRAEVMDAASARTFVFGTYFLEALTTGAALATLELYERFQVIPHMWRVGRRLMEGLDALFEEHGIPARCLGPPCMPQLLFEDEAAETLFFDAALEGGVLFFHHDLQAVSLAHGEEELEHTLRACAGAARKVRERFYPGGGRRSRELSPAAVERHARRRLIRPGVVPAERVHAAEGERWPVPG